MNPQEFVRKMIAEGNVDTLIHMIRRKSDTLYARKKPEHGEVYRFANAFLIAVLSQLRTLPPGETLEYDPLLTVWRDLAVFGVDRDDIADFLEEK